MTATSVITLGIGNPVNLAHFVLTGLNTNPVFTGLSSIEIDVKRRIEALDVQREIGVDSKRRIEALDVQEREAMYTPSLITLPDGSGYWLFGDDSRIMWGSGNTGTGGTVKRRIETLKVKRNG